MDYFFIKHVSNQMRMRNIANFENLKEIGSGNKCIRVSHLAKQSGFSISESGVRLIVDKWLKTRICKGKEYLSLSSLKFSNHILNKMFKLIFLIYY